MVTRADVRTWSLMEEVADAAAEGVKEVVIYI
jgi:hypothetical protein